MILDLVSFEEPARFLILTGTGFELRATYIPWVRPDLGVRIGNARLDSIPARSSRIFFGARHFLLVDF